MDRDTANLDWISFGAVLFDLDGVITPTAEVHERAWAALFEPWDLTPGEHLTYVDGTPRYDGVESSLTSRGVRLPWGDPDDPPGDDTICAMGNRTNEMFTARDGIAHGTVEVPARLDAEHIPHAIVSLSEHARTALAAAGADLVVDDLGATLTTGPTAADENHA